MNTTLSITDFNAIQHSTTIAILKTYVDDAIHNEPNITRDELKDRINTLCTAPINRGVITLAVLDNICKYIDHKNLANNKSRLLNRLFEQAALEELLLTNPAELNNNEINKLKQLKHQVMLLEANLRDKYGSAIRAASESFIKEFNIPHIGDNSTAAAVTMNASEQKR